MRRYLLDSNAVSAFIDHRGTAVERVREARLPGIASAPVNPSSRRSALVISRPLCWHRQSRLQELQLL